jgi:GNAT superfamily N-acetyltransferase
MSTDLQIRKAKPEDTEVVAEILREAARWLEQSGMPLWREEELNSAGIAASIAEGQYFIAENAGNPAGTMRFQLEDPAVWPDAHQLEATYVHKLVVRRCYAGAGVSTALLDWAVARTADLGRRHLRLDCHATRPRLRALYEAYGFRHHSDRQVGPVQIARYEYDVANAYDVAGAAR